MTSTKQDNVFFLVGGTLILSSALFLLPPKGILLGLGALTLGIFMLPFVLRHLSYAFAAWFLIVPFYSNAALQNTLDVGAANMSPERVLFILLIMVFFANICLRQVRVLPITRLEKTMVGFCLIVLVSLWMHGNFERSYLGVVATRFAFPMAGFFLAKNLFKNNEDIAMLMWLLFALGAYLGVTACFEFFGIQSLIFPRYIGDLSIPGFVGRARGPFLQAATNGTAIGMLFFTSIYLYPMVKSSRIRLLVLSLGGVMLLGVFFALTRGAWIGTAVGLLVVAILHRSLRRLLAPVLLIGAVSLPLVLSALEEAEPEGVVTERAADAGNVYYRLNTWLVGLEMFSEHPIFGVGFRRYTDLNRLYQNEAVIGASGVQLAGGDAAHNTYIELAAELGLFGLLPYCAIIIWSLSTSIKLYRSLPAASRARDLILVFWGGALTYFISSFFYTQNSMFLTSLFFALAGIIARWSALREMESRSRFEEIRFRNRPVRIAAERPTLY